MEAKNPREGWAALILRHCHQRRAGVARIRQTWLPNASVRQPDQVSQQALHRRLGATLGATPTNDLAILRTHTDSGTDPR
jgi:hypothetical protein